MAQASEDKLKKWFAELDKDKDGFISVDDAITLLRAGGKVPTTTQIAEIRAEITNPKGIKWEGFHALFTRPSIRPPSKMGDKMLRAFRTVDVNDERALKLNTLQDMLREANIDQDDMDKFLTYLKPDDDGYVEYHGLVELLTK